MTDPYSRSVTEILDALATDRGGLSREEVERRLAVHGPNRLREPSLVNPWQILLHQFTSPLIYVLLGALGLTASLRIWSDAIVIAAVLAINAAIGFFEEYRAASAVQSLMELVSPEAIVVRAKERRRIPAEELVPGDVVELGSGAMVPADLRLIDTRGLQVDESPLTGESVPVDKSTPAIEEANLAPADQRNMAFMGTAVTSGSARAVVVATGSDTEIGRIAEQVHGAERTQTPLALRIDRLARWITIVILVVAVVAAGTGVALGRDLFEMVLLAVALAVAAIPEGLPIVVTVVLAIGVQRMAQRQAVMRNLHAVDTLGSCSTILSDKTGTLTQNQMTVRAIVAGGRGYELSGPQEQREDAETDGAAGGGAGIVTRDDTVVRAEDDEVLRQVLVGGLLCNDVELGDELDLDALGDGDPMEVALVVAAAAGGLDPAAVRASYPRRDTVPFRTEQRYMATVHDDEAEGGQPFVVVKGAPERVGEMCRHRLLAAGGLAAFDEDTALERSQGLAAEGFRMLAIAIGYGEDAIEAVTSNRPGGLTFVGLHGLLDPPRASATEAIARCHEAGIRVMMVTGDHATTAAAIGHRMGIGGDGDGLPDVVAGRELASLSDEELDASLHRTDIYARVSPDQKFRIVERLKAWDEVVAVTGDGVNDAPALETAHIGAAMGSGTDVAKEASDMVVTDDDFASVYAAVEEGRTAFRNIRVATFFLLSTGAADVLVILGALVAGWPLPLLPAQILWVNVVTNGIADVALAFEPGEEALFRRPPRPKSEGVLGRVLVSRLVIVGSWLTAGTLGVFWWSWNVRGDDIELARTIAVTTMVLFQAVHVFNCRSEEVSLFRTPLLTNRVLLVGVLTSVAVHVAALSWSVTQELLRFHPLGSQAWLVSILVAATAIIPNELHKRLGSSARAEVARAGRPAASAHGRARQVRKG